MSQALFTAALRARHILRKSRESLSLGEKLSGWRTRLFDRESLDRVKQTRIMAAASCCHSRLPKNARRLARRIYNSVRGNCGNSRLCDDLGVNVRGPGIYARISLITSFVFKHIFHCRGGELITLYVDGENTRYGCSSFFERDKCIVESHLEYLYRSYFFSYIFFMLFIININLIYSLSLFLRQSFSHKS